MSDTQYLICLSIFFIPYALLDVSNKTAAEVSDSFKVISGTLKHIFKAIETIYLALSNHAPLGCYDGVQCHPFTLGSL